MKLYMTGALCAALCVVTACKKDGTSLDAKDFPSNVGDPAIIELLNPGSGTPKALRLSPVIDSTQIVHFSASIDAGRVSIRMDMNINTVVARIHDDGSFDLVGTPSDVELTRNGDEVSASEIRGAFEVRTTLTPRGENETTTLDEDGAGDAAGPISDSIKYPGYIFPEEPVGMGAKWTAKETVESKGILLFQQVLYEITALEVDSVTMKLTVTQDAPRQSVFLGGQSATIDSYDGRGTGELTQGFANGMPTSLKVEMKQTTQVSAGGSSQKVSASSRIAISLP